ncbi:MAG: hypothetical protein KDD82_00595 [Planctomycetes bacterium]|nr:hypothetical protein [Planctomycetota bacterium]
MSATGDGALVARYLKHRWVRDVADLLQASSPAALAFDDVDMANDWAELRRLANRSALEALCVAWLEADAVDAPGALAALEPELEGERAQAFLQLVAGNLAFHLRSTPALRAWLARSCRRAPFSLPLADLGRLLVRCQGARVVHGWLEGVAEPARSELREAAQPLSAPAVDVLLVEGEQQAVEDALPAACGGERKAYSRAPEGAWRHAILPPRRGFCAVLREGDRIPQAVAERLRHRAGIQRVAWLGLGGEAPALWLHAPGAEPELPPQPWTADDVAGAARALGAVALDPGHARAPQAWAFAYYAELRRSGVRYVAVAPPGDEG